MLPKENFLVLYLAIPFLCRATSLAPDYHELRLLDKLAEAAKSEPSRSTSIRILERIAEGQPENVQDRDLAALEIEPKISDKLLLLKDDYVRDQALIKLAEMDDPRALGYLAKLTPADIGSPTVWQSLLVARRAAAFNRLLSDQEKVDFLVHMLETKPDGPSVAVQSWAVNQLCEAGAQSAMPLIEDTVRNYYSVSTDRADNELKFCRDRIQVISSSSDRIMALKSVLTIPKTLENPQITAWAMNQLVSMHSKAADAEIERYTAELSQLPSGHPAKELLQLSESFRILREYRDK